ncbi:hypothetical protein PAE9249_01629 [Paenibacillus sp. CECT 9249]|nr:hypothetical protein PAE9249_01629 [Paenibacillus sp. CECT 9249]
MPVILRKMPGNAENPAVYRLMYAVGFSFVLSQNTKYNRQRCKKLAKELSV